MNAQEQRLSDWLGKVRFNPQTGTIDDSLAVGLTFPIKREETVMVHKGFRPRGGYCKRGTLLTYRGLAAYAVLFQNEHGKWITVQHNELKNLLP